VVVFVTTNVDDILLLSAFFADPAVRTRAILIGQFAGIGVLTAISIVAALLALAIPAGWVGLLGVVPLALGIRGVHALWRSRRDGADAGEVDAADATNLRSGRAEWMAVAAVTIANGGDNLGVYIPLFSQQLPWIPVYVVVFAVLTALWCAAGFWLVHHAIIGVRIRQYGHVSLPFVLIGLGLYILSDSRVLLR
jgi:cadmium resistance protein CadD (predicted permease)